ncbi:patatin : Patatin OS=bacterium UASB270 GN=U27_05170 PE=4 SV=1: Patatin [Gemmata massiliana]|uniref:PNPLA domain-containing protein n=1 Tax=Gemmata massiliana TaxID=1210884 RepID=A0A6P2CRU7_9BACT|nr:patatin-like phospholipase family protein [Gemmata massiliana]VTR91653.1 patatin : Patatin OS=bacterium UASB270 GN=U27_05170 PE=4 SV=1: Patatin [Gemmata massiliana]
MTKISLVMSGAVSLGSYHAGVLTELLYALDYHRRNGRAYELDVITGASAGSITGALVAYAVMNNFGARTGLHKAWVELASIDRLLQKPPTNALLDPGAVRDIAKECLPEPLVPASPAPFAPEKLWLGFTLSNLNGLNRSISAPGNPGGTHFDSTFFDDIRTYRLVRGRASDPPERARRLWSSEDRATWDDVAEFGIASGAFPLAFPPVRLSRLLWELPLLAAPVPDPLEYTYVDGGTFNNQPIGEAVRLSREADDGELHPDRKYLFVNAAARNDDLNAAINPKSSMWEIAKRLLSCIFAQSRTSDWIRALLVDTQVRWRDGFFAQLVSVVRTTTVPDPAPLLRGLTQLAQQIEEVEAGQPDARSPRPSADEMRAVEEKHAERLATLDPAPTPEQRSALLRLFFQLDATERKYAAALRSDPPLPQTKREVLVLLFYLLDHVADLDERKQLAIWITSPPEGGLAGTQLEWFGGFFEQRWREYNFRKGRVLARPTLESMLGAYPEQDGGAPYAITPDLKNSPNERLRDTKPAPRVRFRDALVERVKTLAEVFEPHGFRGWLLRHTTGGVGAIAAEYARHLLDDQLEL